jgi:hypothetical protein
MTATLCFRLWSLGDVTGVALFTHGAIAAEIFTHRDGCRRTALDSGEWDTNCDKARVSLDHYSGPSRSIVDS